MRRYLHARDTSKLAECYEEENVKGVRKWRMSRLYADLVERSKTTPLCEGLTKVKVNGSATRREILRRRDKPKLDRMLMTEVCK